VLTAIDVFTRECLALLAALSFRGADLARFLADLVALHGCPRMIQSDQGTEFISMDVDQWAYWTGMRLDFRRPGQPGESETHVQCHCQGPNIGVGAQYWVDRTSETYSSQNIPPFYSAVWLMEVK
jgi:hypothetical protein